MARIRAIKPEFWSSPNLPADPWARLLYIAMWNWADDAGVGTANPRELAGFAFPNDDGIDVGAVRRMCADIAAHFGAKFYTVDGRPYYAIPSWAEHQKFDRRRGGRYPGPDQAEKWLYQDECENAAQCADSAPTVRRHVGAVSAPEQGNRGTGELTSSEADEGENRPDIDKIVDLLVTQLRARDCKIPASLTAWRKSARLLLDKDHRNLDEALAVLEWSQHDEFWSSNILSMPKFREQYDKLRLKSGIRSKPAADPEQFLRDCWEKGSFGPITTLTGYPCPFPEFPGEGEPGFDKDTARRDFYRKFIEDKRDELLMRVREAM